MAHNGYVYTTCQARWNNFEKKINEMTGDGWEVVSHSFDCEWKTYKIIFKRPKQTLNADIRNKLGPLQTIMDLVNTWGLKNPSGMDDDVITQVFNEAIEEANKSIEYLKHIGE